MSTPILPTSHPLADRAPAPIRVWLYRGWCWSCRATNPNMLMPHACGRRYASPGEAADAGRKHLRREHHPLAVCAHCHGPVASPLAGCDRPECVTRDIAIEAAFKRREDI